MTANPGLTLGKLGDALKNFETHADRVKSVPQRILSQRQMR
jgi:hypothetical protein